MEYLCDYGNCQERQEGKRMITITRNIGGSRNRFCSWEHAAAFCRERAESNQRNAGWYETVADAHAAADSRCGRSWQCACGPCRGAREAGYTPKEVQ